MTLFDLLISLFWRTQINHLRMEKFLWLIFFFCDEWNSGMKFGDMLVGKLIKKVGSPKLEVRSPKLEDPGLSSTLNAQRSTLNAQRSPLNLRPGAPPDFRRRNRIL